jgi:hypothetical protein
VQYGTFLRLDSTGAPDAAFGTGGTVDISNFVTPARVAFTASGNLVTSLVIQDRRTDAEVLRRRVDRAERLRTSRLSRTRGPTRPSPPERPFQLTSAGSADPRAIRSPTRGR